MLTSEQHYPFSCCWFLKCFLSQSLPLIISICLSQHWCEGKANQNRKLLSDQKEQGEYTDTSVLRRFMSEPSQEFSNLNFLSVFSQASGIFSHTVCNPVLICCHVVFRSLWLGKHNRSHPWLSLVQKAGRHPVHGEKLWMDQGASQQTGLAPSLPWNHPAC